MPEEKKFFDFSPSFFREFCLIVRSIRRHREPHKNDRKMLTWREAFERMSAKDGMETGDETKH